MLLFARKQNHPQQSSPLHPPATSAAANASIHSHPILRLQRTIGNQAVGRLLQAGGENAWARAGINPAAHLAQDSDKRAAGKDAPVGMQAKLTVGAAGDAYEQEADRVAERVTRASESKLRRSCACAGSCSKCQDEDEHAEHAHPVVQPSRVAGHEAMEGEAPPVVEEVLRSPGRTLDASTRDFFETSFGRDFGHVRVHTDERAARSAEAVGAQAYTVGGNIAFAAGQYAPETSSGRRLLAHELTHVAQQDGRAHAQVQRQKGKATPDAAKAAANTPKLELTKSKNGAACACIIVVHNNERNARKTAQLMHENCSYNLVLRMPDNSARDVTLPGSTAKTDPNSLFPEDIAQECLTAAQSGKDCSAGEKDAEKQVKKQFFLTVKDCSNSFTLPVVALHNNDINDTKGYLDKKDKEKIDVSGLKMDVDKSKKETGADQLDKLKKALTEKFGGDIKKSLMDKSGKTNIFRWCQSSDLSRCHIGDPEHPDNVVWVTNEKDFQKLSKQNVNVAFQSEIPTKKSESEGDLSTLFLILQKITKSEIADIDATIKLLESLMDVSPLIFKSAVWLEMINRALTVMKLEALRYINIETPGDAIADQTDAERVRNYEAIVVVLKAVGLHCCGPDPAAEAEAEKKVKAGLALAKKK